PQIGSVWYLPHHPVIHPRKPGKVRVVFDCACQSQKVSLNSQLLTGPDIVNSLIGVLLRFRQYAYVVTADVESMFHQVKVPENDRDAFRFLWWEEGNYTKSIKLYRMTVHLFGAASSPFCASFALNTALKEHMTESDNIHITTAERAFYVDDCLYSADTPEGLHQFVTRVKDALSAGGFHLTKWSSNVSGILAGIPPEEVAEDRLDVDLQPSSLRRTLGVQWDMLTDQFMFHVDSQTGVLTKRSMLSYIASLYDPLGFVVPVLLTGRLLFQQLCKIQLGWDEEPPVEMGIVERAEPSLDGCVREVTLRTKRGTFRRDVRQLYLLEAHAENVTRRENSSVDGINPRPGEC
ncbi:hypothetical protein B566_EDAN019551, partial [Ephemera danica]